MNPELYALSVALMMAGMGSSHIAEKNIGLKAMAPPIFKTLSNLCAWLGPLLVVGGFFIYDWVYPVSAIILMIPMMSVINSTHNSSQVLSDNEARIESIKRFHKAMNRYYLAVWVSCLVGIIAAFISFFTPSYYSIFNL